MTDIERDYKKAPAACSGFSLLEAVFGLAALTLILSAVTSIASFSNQRTHALNTTLARDELILFLHNSALDRDAILQTVNQNPALKQCANPVNPFDPANCPSLANMPISLYDRLGHQLAGPGVPGQSSPPPAPVWYSLSGARCPSSVPGGTGSCIVAVTSFFVPQCLPAAATGQPAPTCAKAEVIDLRYNIVAPFPDPVTLKTPFPPYAATATLNLDDLGL